MSLNQRREVAIKYRVEDLRSAMVPGTPLSNVLRDLELGEKPISKISQHYLMRLGLLVLLRYARNDVSFAEYLEAAEIEQSKRRPAAKTKIDRERREQKAMQVKLTQIEEAAAAKKHRERREQKAMQVKLTQIEEAAAAKKRAFDNDPKNVAKAKQVKLRQKYGLSDFIEKAHFPKLMDILCRVDNGIRLSEDEIVWLSAEGRKYFTEELREGFHRNEALFYAGEFKKNGDPWCAVNASSHCRKCRKPEAAERMLSTIDLSVLRDPKLKSAILTTQGGVKRDLEKLTEAIGLGEQAHRLTPEDFRPCTLLGAVNMEIGQCNLGQSWYTKAVERGYREESVDRELRGIFWSLGKPKQETLRNHLLALDPDRYSWARKSKP